MDHVPSTREVRVRSYKVCYYHKGVDQKNRKTTLFFPLECQSVHWSSSGNKVPSPSFGKGRGLGVNGNDVLSGLIDDFQVATPRKESETAEGNGGVSSGLGPLAPLELKVLSGPPYLHPLRSSPERDAWRDTQSVTSRVSGPPKRCGVGGGRTGWGPHTESDFPYLGGQDSPETGSGPRVPTGHR